MFLQDWYDVIYPVQTTDFVQVLAHSETAGAEHTGNQACPETTDTIYLHAALLIEPSTS